MDGGDADIDIVRAVANRQHVHTRVIGPVAKDQGRLLSTTSHTAARTRTALPTDGSQVERPISRPPHGPVPCIHRAER
jgi:hypothetical protein